jgi:anti-sigma regulatory factor (Ser/Thr protein kinase)
MRTTRTFENVPGSVTAARRFATEALSGVPGETVEVVALLVSELATNCVRHTDRGFELAISRTAREIRVEARDSGAGKPTMRSPGPTDPTGRGLRIVDMLAGAWGVEQRTGQGKTVWFTITAGLAPGSEQPWSQRAKRRATARTSRRPAQRSSGSGRRSTSPGGSSSRQLGDDHRRVRRR